MHIYILLTGETTGLLLCDEAGTLGLRPRCDDSCVWEWTSESSLRNASTGREVEVEPTGGPPSQDEMTAIDAAFGEGASQLVPRKFRLAGDTDKGLHGQLVFSERAAPARLPSVYLAELEAQGWTVIENLLSPAMLTNLVANANKLRDKHAEKEARMRADQDLRPYQSNDNIIRVRSLMEEGDSFLGMTPVVSQALVHPVSLWVLESYLGVDSIHYCSCPGVSILRPAEKSEENSHLVPGGWHCDYPYPVNSEIDAHTYMLGKLGEEEFEKLDASIRPRFPNWKQRKDRLGMQFNIAITDFTPERGSTQFVLGSHEFDTPPPPEMNAVPTVAGVGPHQDVVQVSYSAGSGILYDSRTYHRSPPELNVSGEERWAMLSCIVPSFVRDMRVRDDKVLSAEGFARATNVHAALTERELNDVLKMLCDDESGVPRQDIKAAVAAALPGTPRQVGSDDSYP